MMARRSPSSAWGKKCSDFYFEENYNNENKNLLNEHISSNEKKISFIPTTRFLFSGRFKRKQPSHEIQQQQQQQRRKIYKLNENNERNHNDNENNNFTSKNLAKGFLNMTTTSLTTKDNLTFTPNQKLIERKKSSQIVSSWFSGFRNKDKTYNSPFMMILFLFGCTFLLTLLLGLLVGYYVNVIERRTDNLREEKAAASGTLNSVRNGFLGHFGEYNFKDWSFTEKCYLSKSNKFLGRKCEPNPRLESLHGNIMFYVNGDRMTQYMRNFPKDSPKYSEQEWDEKMTKHLHQEFQDYGLDKVEDFTYEVVSSQANPDFPKQLELVDIHGKVKLNLQIPRFFPFGEQKNKSEEFNDVYSSKYEEDSFKAFLFFANYGTSDDFNHLRRLNLNLTNQMILLRTGNDSIEEKLFRAQQEGVQCVLFYSDFDENIGDSRKNENSNTSESIFISSYKKDHLNNLPQPKFVYNVSLTLATQILSILQEATDGFFKTNQNRSGDYHQMSVSLKFFSSLKKVKVSNVVGTLYGISKPDEQVLVGSQRLYDQINYTTLGQSSTAMLLELIHSLLHVRDIESWQPQRTIKFISWGTATGNDDAGFKEYLKKNNLIVNSRNIGYVELEDNIGKMCNDLSIRSDSLSLETIIRATEMVPDPLYPESSISIRFKTSKFKKTLSSPLESRNLISQLVDEHTLLMSHSVPTSQFSCIYSTFSGKAAFSERTPSDRNHHYRHHMAVTRVASLELLALADRQQHGYNVDQLILDVQHQVLQFLSGCHRNYFKAVNKTRSTLLDLINKSQQQQPIELNLLKTLTINKHLQQFLQDQILLLHRILSPLTRLNSSVMNLERLQIDKIDSNQQHQNTLKCSLPVLTAIMQRLEEASSSLSQ